MFNVSLSTSNNDRLQYLKPRGKEKKKPALVPSN